MEEGTGVASKGTCDVAIIAFGRGAASANGMPRGKNIGLTGDKNDSSCKKQDDRSRRRAHARPESMVKASRVAVNGKRNRVVSRKVGQLEVV